ncbi:hypothetical protein DFH06DRAFT_758716 [Mycena polygramma]|nr:hypothetical protein DFH06DRAFT_758716 [Mycena polygramma]
MLVELEEDRARVAELQTRILAAERTLSVLRLEQSQAQERLDSYKYPVLTLPNEITSEIFVHVLPPYPDFPELIGPFSPTSLTQICRSWREIALGTPKLWSAISLPADDPEWELRILELWLQRSLHRPLYIELGPVTTWAVNKFVEAMTPHRARWEYLDIDLEGDNLQFLNAPMPLLRHLELTVTTEDEGTLDPVAAYGVPLLHTVVLDDLAAERIILPWTQLTSLTLYRVFPSECLPIVAQTRNLVHLELRVFRDSLSHNAEPNRDIQLPCLESLTLVHCGSRPVTDLLPLFIVPALRSLQVPEKFLAPEPITALQAFVSKSGCTLDELHLTGGISVSENSYRQAFPMIRKFSFETADDSDAEDYL